MKINCVIFDIDGTLANCEHRRHLVTGKKKYFKRFYEAMGNDVVKNEVRRLLNFYSRDGFKIFLCTGRPEKYRDITANWLADNEIDYDELMMRPDGREYDPDFEVKQTMLDKILLTNKVHVAVDDRDQVVKMWRSNGITCFQVADGDF